MLPFQNAEADADLDFLRLALPDEIATILSHIRSVSVRPFATTSQYGEPDVDPQQAGREMRAATVVTGHFLRAGELLRITLEAIDVESNRSLWRDMLDVPAGNLIATQTQIGLRVRGGLAAALGWPRLDSSGGADRRRSLRTVSPHGGLDAGSGQQRSRHPTCSSGRSRSIPRYPPAWVALARRYYVDSRYGIGDRTP